LSSLTPFILLLAARAAYAGAAADLAKAIGEISLDPGECYRVREVTIVKEDARFYLTDGYLIFAKPVAGARVAALFTSEVDGGDAEVLLMPPSRSERRSLASYTGSPNMDEHFDSAAFIFSDDSFREITAGLAGNPFNRKLAEMGPVMADKWSSTVRNIANSFETRLVLDLLSAHPPGFFAATLHSKKAGNFDITYDPTASEQMLVGQVAHRDGKPYLDIWTSFEALSLRNGKMKPALSRFVLHDYRIDAALDPELSLHVVTKVKMKTARAEAVLPFEISPRMRVNEATIDGVPAEIHRGESMRSNLILNNGNDLFLLVPARPLEAGRDYEIEFHGEGLIIANAGNRVYYVGARANWYPRAGLQFATYDLKFRYPRDLDLVTPGDVIEDKNEGEFRITRRRTAAPIRFAGFNLGAYERTRVTRGGYTVEVCANRGVERALEPKPMSMPQPLPQQPTYGRRRGQPIELPQAGPMPAPPPRPTSALQELASEIASELEFMSQRFGPPPLKVLTVSPVPGTFGQGFPGLIYLSTLSYLAPSMPSMSPREQAFFTELLHAHETAHQWWGNIVTADGYHDGWLMEALANYSSLLYLEKRKGARTVDTMLNEYRDSLLKKLPSGGTEDSAGAIVMGPRLASSLSPDAWKHIVYGKGSWILHMLRRRMGDEKFLAMLAELRRRYQWKSITTDEFRQLAAGFLPPKSPDPKLEAFFDVWVYGTGIPHLKMTWSVKGKAPALRVTGTLTQTDVADDFSVPVPIEIQFAKGKQIHWVQSADEPVSFSVAVRQAPAKVLLDPAMSVLKR
jgi:Peptidase family M1 domain